ncbi:MAG: hypothetical protein GY749_20140 [Desulfobacteraceae bacterium]|nr:hypothetical protein [Desulfobacteraceae bacterium]
MKNLIISLIYALVICVAIFAVGVYFDIKPGEVKAGQNADTEKIVAAVEEKLKDLDDKIKEAVKKGMKEKKIKHIAPKVIKKIECDVVGREWIFINEGMHILSGQVLVKLKNLCCYANKLTAYFEVTPPNMEKKVWNNLGNGDRRQFEYNNKTYFFDVMEVGNLGVSFTIKDRLDKIPPKCRLVLVR